MCSSLNGLVLSTGGFDASLIRFFGVLLRTICLMPRRQHPMPRLYPQDYFLIHFLFGFVVLRLSITCLSDNCPCAFLFAYLILVTQPFRSDVILLSP